MQKKINSFPKSERVQFIYFTAFPQLRPYKTITFQKHLFKKSSTKTLLSIK